jgi:uncharacterized iron-regulated membrane protein
MAQFSTVTDRHQTPAKPGKAWYVTDAGREWPGTASAVGVDPSADKITRRADFNDISLAAKLTRWTIAAQGRLFGLPNQLLLLAVAVVRPAMVIGGYVMWWKRRPTRGSVWPVRVVGASWARICFYPALSR